MHVRCPHCHSPNDVADTEPVLAMTCSDCNCAFNLIHHDDTSDTRTFVARDRKLSHFDLLEEVGIGSFGSVWKARDRQLDRLVAVKLPRRAHLDDGEAERFLRDAKAAARLLHPGIAQVYEIGRDGDTPYIASQFIEGANLKDWLAHERMSSREGADLVIKIAEAVHHAHECGVIHRDLKPANVMLDLDKNPHVIDFGLAKREAGDTTVTIEGVRLGTPAYMAPEQARGDIKSVDRRSDVYSLGVILFELLTGERPFRGEERMLVVQILRDQAPSPRSLNARVPRDLETIALKCLQKDPKDRYQTAGALADDLRRWLNGDGIAARPPGMLQRLATWCVRYERIQMAGIFSLVMLAVFAVWEITALVALGLNLLQPPNREEAMITFGAFVFIVFPLASWVSWHAARGRKTAIWLGAVFSAAIAVYSALALTGRYFDAGGYLDDIMVRLPTMTICLLASLAALGLHGVSLAAYYANREIMVLQAPSRSGIQSK